MQKIARTTMYHVAPAQRRRQIQQEGLKVRRSEAPSIWPGEDRPDGVYMWDTIDNAKLYAKRNRVTADPDFWRVDVTGLHLEEDPYFSKLIGDWEQEEQLNQLREDWAGPHGIPGAFRSFDDVPPDRLSLYWANPWFPVEANIFDPIEKELDQRIFRGIEPRPTITNFIKKLYYRELKREFGMPNPEDYVDLYITGSLTTYQYSNTSDCDISVFPNYPAFKQDYGLDPKQTRKRLVSMSIDKIDGTFLPGGLHPLQFFVVAIENRPMDLYQPGLRSAYSIDDEMWIVEPERERSHDIATELPELYSRANEMATKMTDMLGYDPEQARELWRQVHMKRQLDQQQGLGDFSEGNIVYKWLLHEGLFDRIRNELGEYIAKIASDDFDPVDHFLQGIYGQGGDIEKVRRFWHSMPNLRFTPEEIDSYIDQAAAIYAEQQVERLKQMDEFERAREEQERIRQYDVEVRWGHNRETGEWSIGLESEDHEIHPDMFERWMEGKDWMDYDPGDKFVFGYATFNSETGQVDTSSDDSYDIPGTELTEDEARVLENYIQEMFAHIDKQTATSWDNISLKVIYDLNQDRIILGTQSEAANLPRGKILGEYDGKKAILETDASHWINANYFKRLWGYSYPTRPLEEVSFKSGLEGDEIIMPTRPRKRGMWKKAEVEYDEAWVYVGEPFNQLLHDGTSEHMHVLANWLESLSNPEPVEQKILGGDIPLAFGHIGHHWYGEGEDDVQYYWVVYSDYLAGVPAAARLVIKAVEELKKSYPNITEYVGRYHGWYS